MKMETARRLCYAAGHAFGLVCVCIVTAKLGVANGGHRSSVALTINRMQGNLWRAAALSKAMVLTWLDCHSPGRGEFSFGQPERNTSGQ